MEPKPKLKFENRFEWKGKSTTQTAEQKKKEKCLKSAEQCQSVVTISVVTSQSALTALELFEHWSIFLDCLYCLKIIANFPSNHYKHL